MPHAAAPAALLVAVWRLLALRVANPAKAVVQAEAAEAEVVQGDEINALFSGLRTRQPLHLSRYASESD
jgi:hypothetical protein